MIIVSALSQRKRVERERELDKKYFLQMKISGSILDIRGVRYFGISNTPIYTFNLAY